MRGLPKKLVVDFMKNNVLFTTALILLISTCCIRSADIKTFEKQMYDIISRPIKGVTDHLKVCYENECAIEFALIIKKACNAYPSHFTGTYITQHYDASKEWYTCLNTLNSSIPRIMANSKTIMILYSADKTTIYCITYQDSRGETTAASFFNTRTNDLMDLTVEHNKKVLIDCKLFSTIRGYDVLQDMKSLILQHKSKHAPLPPRTPSQSLYSPDLIARSIEGFHAATSPLTNVSSAETQRDAPQARLHAYETLVKNITKAPSSSLKYTVELKSQNLYRQPFKNLLAETDTALWLAINELQQSQKEISVIVLSFQLMKSDCILYYIPETRASSENTCILINEIGDLFTENDFKFPSDIKILDTFTIETLSQR